MAIETPNNNLSGWCLVAALVALVGIAFAFVWLKGYHANYKKGYHESFQRGLIAGREEGEKIGLSEAQEAARTGNAWRCYANYFYGFFIVGLAFGIIAQYGILFKCRLAGKLPKPLVLALIPGIRRSLAYSVYRRRAQILSEFEEACEKLRRAEKLRRSQVKAAHEAVIRHMRVAKDIDEIRLDRLMEIFEKELEKSESETERRISRCRCPHCGGAVVYDKNRAGAAVKCPHGCGGGMTLP